jgi:hypothetical protein
LLLAIAVWGSACVGEPDVTPTVTTPASPATSGAPTEDPSDEGFAVWPEDTEEGAFAASENPKPYRFDAEETALAFASEVLAWDDAATEPYGGPVECGDRTCTLIRREPGGPAALVIVAQLVPELWSVTYVGSPDETSISLSLGVEGSKVNAVFDLGDAASARMTVGYGGRGAIHVYTETSTKAWDLGFEPDTTGHYILTFRDADGSVTAALGAPLPKGDLAAS